MAFDHAETRLEHKLRARLKEMAAKSEEEVSQGQIPDFATYKDRCGYIRAIRMALQALDETVKHLNRD